MNPMLHDPRIDTLRVRVQDITSTGHCVRGTKQWFEHHGFDFRHVLKHGIPARDLLMTNDAQAITVVRKLLDRMGS